MWVNPIPGFATTIVGAIVLLVCVFFVYRGIQKLQ
jgi:hypothetical protein